MMEMCGDAENRLASELMQHEVNIEKEILDPLNQLAEVKELVFIDYACSHAHIEISAS